MYHKALLLAEPPPIPPPRAEVPTADRTDITTFLSSSKNKKKSNKKGKSKEKAKGSRFIDANGKKIISVEDRQALPELVLEATKPDAMKRLVSMSQQPMTPAQIAEWDRRKFMVTVRGNRSKFSQDEDLKKQLLETGHRELVEASPTDRIWGIGFPGDQAMAHRSEWGQNLLGRALMVVREEIRQAEAEKTGGDDQEDDE